MDSRQAFLDGRRAICRQRFDELHASRYDEQWGHVNPTHARFVERLVGQLSAGDRVLDAGCGTGKYWPALLAAGLEVFGVDQSAGMLSRAAAKHPGVATRRLALQDLAAANELREGCDGLLCVDVLENVGPEDWPGVLAGLVRTLRPDGLGYITVEIPDQPVHAERPLAPGEVIEDGAYHYYPDEDSVRSWLAEAGFAIEAEEVGDGYWHLLVRLS